MTDFSPDEVLWITIRHRARGAEGPIAPAARKRRQPGLDGSRITTGNFTDDEVEYREVVTALDLIDDRIDSGRNLFGGP